MKKLTLVLLSTVVLSITAFAVGLISSKWNYDKSHQKVSFSVSHMTLSESEGYFKDVDATITAPGADFSNAQAEMTIQVASINTEDDKRDEHLKGEDFFDVSKYPTITFKSTSFTKKKDLPNAYLIKGNLTMHGVTKPMQFGAIAKVGTNPYSKKEVAGFKLVGSLNRKDFGIATSTPDAIVGNAVSFQINAEFIKE